MNRDLLIHDQKKRLPKKIVNIQWVKDGCSLQWSRVALGEWVITKKETAEREREREREIWVSLLFTFFVYGWLYELGQKQYSNWVVYKLTRGEIDIDLLRASIFSNLCFCRVCTHAPFFFFIFLSFF